MTAQTAAKLEFWSPAECPPCSSKARMSSALLSPMADRSQVVFQTEHHGMKQKLLLSQTPLPRAICTQLPTPNLPKCLILKGLLKSFKNLKLQLQSTLGLPEDGEYSQLCKNEWKMNSDHNQILIKCKLPDWKSKSLFFLVS